MVGTTSMTDIATAIQNLSVIGTAVYTQNGAGDTDYTAAAENVPQATLAGGSDAVTGLTGDLVFELSGTKGSEVYSFQSGTTGAQIRDAINLVTEATGVSAAFAANTLTVTSTAYGSDAFVGIKVLSDAGGFEASLSGTRDTGTDIVATILSAGPHAPLGHLLVAGGFALVRTLAVLLLPGIILNRVVLIAFDNWTRAGAAPQTEPFEENPSQDGPGSTDEVQEGV